MPFENMELAPDVVLFIVNPYQAMRFQQGYLYHLGGHSAYNSSAIQALCAEITVGSYLFGEMTQSVLCPSTRLLAKWKDEEMVIGLPFEHFSKTVEGIMATSKTTDTPKRKREISKRYAERRKDNSEGVDENISPEENSRI